MSATTTTDKSSVQPQAPSTPSFTDWRPASEREPTEEEERKARERTLEIGNETEINYEKAPTGQEDYYERLDLHNRDCYWKHRDEIDMPASLDNDYKKHILDSIANKLELTPLQHQKAFARLFELDLPQFGYRIDAVAFCLCGIVLKEEVAERYGDDAPYHPQRNAESNPDNFALVESQLIEEDGATTKRYIQKVWGKLLHGDPPTRSGDSWEAFVQARSQVQNNPHYLPDHKVS